MTSAGPRDALKILLDKNSPLNDQERSKYLEYYETGRESRQEHHGLARRRLEGLE